MVILNNVLVLSSFLSLTLSIIIFGPILHNINISTFSTLTIILLITLNITTFLIIEDFRDTNKKISIDAYNQLTQLTDNQYNLIISGWKSVYLTHSYSFSNGFTGQEQWNNLQFKEIT